MQETSQLYKTLRQAQGSWVEVSVSNLDTETDYGLAELYQIRIYSSLFEDNGPAIGGTISAKAKLKIKTDSESWPRMSRFRIRIRMVSEDESERSEWITLGTYFTDTREQDAAGDGLTITGYDAMRLLETSWIDKVQEQQLPTVWPITAKAAVELAVGTTQFEIDSRTVLDNTVPFIGLDTLSTVRDILGTAAAGVAGNWCITPSGKLRMVPLALTYEELSSAIAGIAIVGKAVAGNGSSANIYQLNRAAEKISTSEPIPAITGTKLTAENGDTAEAGTDTGYILKGNCNFSSSAAASMALSKCSGFRYLPFSASGAFIDPACELGDFVLISGTGYPIYLLDWTISVGVKATVSAPVEHEVEHEYDVPSEKTKTLQKTEKALKNVQTELESSITQTASEIRMAISESKAATDEEIEALENLLEEHEDSAEQTKQQLQSSIEQTATSIRTEISENYYTAEGTDGLIAGLQSSFEQTAQGFEVQVNRISQEIADGDNAIKQYIRYEDGVVIIGTTEFNQEIRVATDEIAMIANGIKMTYWNQNEQLTPNRLHIPAGGSLQEGDFIWQPRSSGNLSLMWIGD